MTSTTEPTVGQRTRVAPRNSVAGRTAGEGSSRMAARMIGVLILLGWLTYGPGGAITESIVTEADPLAAIAANHMTFALGGVLMLLNSLAVVGIGVLWFPVLRRHSERVAVSYLATRMFEAVTLVIGVVSLLAMSAVSASAAAGGAELQAMASMAIEANNLSYLIGMAGLGAGSLFFCWLLYRTSLVPKPLAAGGIAGYGIFAAGMVLEILGYGVGLLLTIPGGLFELAFAGWLIVKGLNPSADEAAR